jgi:hypothetical protein
MRLYPHKQFADAKEERRQGERGFTMVEIAIAIGVIGFALVAVIGILPAGMNVQKDNREDNAISQDAPFFVDAIRNGGTTNDFVNEGLDFLTNYVEKISFYGVTNGIFPSNPYASFSNFDKGGGGAEIIGLLSTPEFPNVTLSNYTLTRAIVRSLASSAVQQNGANQVMSFRYQMDVEIVPFVNIAPDSIDIFSGRYAYGTPDYIIRSNRWLEVNTAATTTNLQVNLPLAYGSLVYSLWDVRLHFSWPVLPGANGAEIVGPGRQSYRTSVGSGIAPGTLLSDGAQPWFFRPQLYATNLGAL